MPRARPTLALLAALAAPAAAQWDDARLRPFVIDHRAAAASPAPSPADVSFLLDAPAGKHGFVGVRGGHLALPNGNNARALSDLGRIYEVGPERRFERGGYALSTYTLRPRPAQ